MKKFIGIPVGLMALVATVAATTHNANLSAAADDASYTIPSEFAAVNECNGDAVTLTGELHFVIHSSTSEGGVVHGYYSLNGRYTGQGVPSLQKYQGSYDYLDSYTIGDNSAYTAMNDIDVTLTNQTSLDNYVARITLKITINSNGVPTAQVDNASIKCNG